MEKVTILDNEFATMWYYPDTKIVHHQIKKYIYGEHLQELLNRGIETIQKYHAQKWISDDRNNNALTPQDQEWVKNDWLPNAVKAGWKYWAIVNPEKLMGQLCMERQANMHQITELKRLHLIIQVML
jgi:hypothetical protein